MVKGKKCVFLGWGGGGGGNGNLNPYYICIICFTNKSNMLTLQLLLGCKQKICKDLFNQINVSFIMSLRIFIFYFLFT